MAVTVPQINFTPLSQLGTLYSDAKLKSGRQTLLSELGQNAGWDQMARGFYGIGDMDAGVQFQKLAEAKAERAADNARANAGLVPSSVREFEYAKRNGYAGSFADWQTVGGSGGGYGVTPVYGLDPQGNEVIMQVGKSGEAVRTKLPDGVTPLGIGGRERQKVLGKSGGEAQSELGGALDKAEYGIQLIDGALNHPGLETATGWAGQVDPRNYIGGTDATNFRTRVEQLQGQAFLEAYQSLKGGGAISEAEGTKAQDAIGRLNRAQSAEEYRKSLNELKNILRMGMARARRRAVAPNGATPAQAQPSSGVADNDPMGLR